MKNTMVNQNEIRNRSAHIISCILNGSTFTVPGFRTYNFGPQLINDDRELTKKVFTELTEKTIKVFEKFPGWTSEQIADYVGDGYLQDHEELYELTHGYALDDFCEFVKDLVDPDFQIRCTPRADSAA